MRYAPRALLCRIKILKNIFFFAFLPFLLNFRKFCPHALKGQKPLAQGGH